MHELELKAVVEDLAECRRRLLRLGAVCREHGTLHDRRFDTADRRLRAQDVVLRVRHFAGTPHSYATLDWKGAASVAQGYKEREEISLSVGDGDVAASILDKLGFVITFEIEREVEIYEYQGATVRFEQYARMDTLVEVEGAPEAIEQAIAAVGIARAAFGTGRLADFVAAYESRTGTRAAVTRGELAKPSRHQRDDA